MWGRCVRGKARMRRHGLQQRYYQTPVTPLWYNSCTRAVAARWYARVPRRLASPVKRAAARGVRVVSW